MIEQALIFLNTENLYSQEDLNKFPKYRLEQIKLWLHKGVDSFDGMSNIPKELREYLKTRYFIGSCKIKDKKISQDSTVKYLFELHDKEVIESVVMKYNHGYSMCLSTPESPKGVEYMGIEIKKRNK